MIFDRRRVNINKKTRYSKKVQRILRVQIKQISIEKGCNIIQAKGFILRQT